MRVWNWRLGRLHHCKKEYDSIVNFTHLCGRFWWRKTTAAQEKVKQAENTRASEDHWWDKQVREAVDESEEIQQYLATLAFYEQPTELEVPCGLPAYAMKGDDTRVIRPRAA